MLATSATGEERRGCTQSISREVAYAYELARKLFTSMIYSTHITSGQDPDSPRLQSAGACSQLMSRSTHVAPLTSPVMRTVSGISAVTPVHRTPSRRPFRPTGPSLRRRAASSLGPPNLGHGRRGSLRSHILPLARPLRLCKRRADAKPPAHRAIWHHHSTNGSGPGGRLHGLQGSRPCAN